MKDQLLKFINDKNLLDENQSAFREKHSCETLLNSLIYEWKIKRENGYIIIIIFLDLKRAFETVDREIMLQILESIGIRENELEWFRSFLENRKQCTKFKSVISNEKTVPIGLPH